MALPTKTDQVVEGLNRLISEWDDSPNVQGLLKAYLTSIQEIEDSLFQLLEERGVFEAVGTQLDIIGVRVGEPRFGRNDPDYRTAILRRVSINVSDATAPVITEVLKTISGSDVVNLFEHKDAFFFGYITRNPSHSLAIILEEVAAAGVKAKLLFDDEGDSFIGARVIPDENVFCLSDGSLLELERDGESEPVYLEVDGTRIISFGGRSTLPFIGAGQKTNPLARIVEAINYQIEDTVISVEVDNSEVLALDEETLLTFQTIRGDQ